MQTSSRGVGPIEGAIKRDICTIYTGYRGSVGDMWRYTVIYIYIYIMYFCLLYICIYRIPFTYTKEFNIVGSFWRGCPQFWKPLLLSERSGKLEGSCGISREAASWTQFRV